MRLAAALERTLVHTPEAGRSVLRAARAEALGAAGQEQAAVGQVNNKHTKI